LAVFEDWTGWCRDPLLALGCRDLVERIDRVKADDPHRHGIVELGGAMLSVQSLTKPKHSLEFPTAK
jgi:hypothetical protein